MMLRPNQPVSDSRRSSPGGDGRAGFRPFGMWIRSCALVLILSYLSASALAVAENWHHSWHDEEGGHDHLCLVTLLQSGHCEANGGGDLPLVLPPRRDYSVLLVTQSILGGPLPGLKHGRAPPL